MHLFFGTYFWYVFLTWAPCNCFAVSLACHTMICSRWNKAYRVGLSLVLSFRPITASYCMLRHYHTCNLFPHSGHWPGDQGAGRPIPSSVVGSLRSARTVSLVAQLMQRRDSWQQTDSCTTTVFFCSSRSHLRQYRCKEFFCNMSAPLLESAVAIISVPS